MAESIHQSHDKGEFTVFYQYVGIDLERPDEPCMVLGSNGAKRRAWVIPMSSAYKYADSKSGAPTQYLIAASVQIAEMFNLYPGRSTVKKISDAIVDCLPDLLKMPPAPPQDAKRMIEHAIEHEGLNLSINGTKVLH